MLDEFEGVEAHRLNVTEAIVRQRVVDDRLARDDDSDKLALVNDRLEVLHAADHAADPRVRVCAARICEN